MGILSAGGCEYPTETPQAFGRATRECASIRRWTACTAVATVRRRRARAGDCRQQFATLCSSAHARARKSAAPAPGQPRSLVGTCCRGCSCHAAARRAACCMVGLPALAAVDLPWSSRASTIGAGLAVAFSIVTGAPSASRRRSSARFASSNAALDGEVRSRIGVLELKDFPRAVRSRCGPAAWAAPACSCRCCTLAGGRADRLRGRAVLETDARYTAPTGPDARRLGPCAADLPPAGLSRRGHSGLPMRSRAAGVSVGPVAPGPRPGGRPAQPEWWWPARLLESLAFRSASAAPR